MSTRGGPVAFKRLPEILETYLPERTQRTMLPLTRAEKGSQACILVSGRLCFVEGDFEGHRLEKKGYFLVVGGFKSGAGLVGGLLSSS